MNGAADLGGMMGFGPIDRESGDQLFHDEWERRVFALTLAMGATGSWNIDTSRFARESLPPAQYLSSSYYEIWLAGLEKLLEQSGLLTEAERQDGSAKKTAKPVTRVLAAADVDRVLAAGAPADRTTDLVARFHPGQQVRAINRHPRTHTRLPRYLRGKRGQVVRLHGTHVLPDSNAHGNGENPQWLYAVEFTSDELWGNGRNDSVLADCWESYLEPV